MRLKARAVLKLMGWMDLCHMLVVVDTNQGRAVKHTLEVVVTNQGRAVR